MMIVAPTSVLLSLPEIPDRREHRKGLTGKPGKTAAPIWQRKNLKPLEAKGFEVVAVQNTIDDIEDIS